ncbi:hypothetical protein B5X24_HaOG211241 [Helicoverpa armigera]|uniref:Reverse transcriptase domain-containing protein n=2 Tax=Helicoverpa armigera TaxID=29058 RepID=A0A2W1BGR8_HELAM|nr:hypothetical protein B5X24_HaOG211241 [Helicoverpa armigera]
MSNQPRIFENIETMNLNYPSDHRAIRATIKFTTTGKSRAKFTNNQKSHLTCENEIATYRESLSNMLSDLPAHLENISVQPYYDRIVDAITKSLKNARHNTGKQGAHKILSDRTFQLLGRRKALQKTKNKTRSMRNELSALYKLVNKYITKDYARYRQGIIEKHIQHKGSTKKAYKELRTNKTWIEGLKELDMDMDMYQRKDISSTATKFYTSLYKNRTNINNTSNNTRTVCENFNNPIETTEVIEALKILKSEKSPGSDNITNEALKTAASTLALPLTVLFNKILQKAETPSQWSESEIILIYKKGDPRDVGNYRPISLLPCLYKLFSGIINKRISTVLEDTQPVEQAGFRKGFSTCDHIHALELIIEKYQEYQRSLYITFIDYQKAFDTINHTSIWESLKEHGVEEKYIEVTESRYTSVINEQVSLNRSSPGAILTRCVCSRGGALRKRGCARVYSAAASARQHRRSNKQVNMKAFIVLCALVAVAASAAVREKRGYSSGWSGSLGGYSGGLSGGYSGGLSGGYSGGYSAPAAQVVAVNKVVNVQREVTVPQVVNVRKIVSVPQVVTVKQVVPVSGGYGGSLGGGYSSGSIGYSSGYSSGGISSGGHGGSGWW